MLLRRVSGSGTVYPVAEVVAAVTGAVSALGLLADRFTKRHQTGVTWLVALATDQTASSVVLESGEPVIPGLYRLDASDVS